MLDTTRFLMELTLAVEPTARMTLMVALRAGSAFCPNKGWKSTVFKIMLSEIILKFCKP